MKFRSYSTGMKLLTLIEFAVHTASLLLAAWLLNVQIPHPEQVVANLLLVYATVFAIASQLFSLSLGLYNPKLREPYRAIFRRAVVATVMGGFTLMLVTLAFAERVFPPEALLLTVIFSIGLVSLIRFFDFTYEFLAQKKINVLVIGAGERASIIEKRMKRRVDRKRFRSARLRGDARRFAERHPEGEKVHSRRRKTSLPIS
jgi:FlaA1/EpsC-like NDP-sugar epimerase